MKKLDKEIEKMTNAFLSWPLPESACADLCAIKQGKGRVGTNLLSFTDAQKMFQCVTAQRLTEILLERENMCAFIRRLCRQSYKLGLRNKLTDSAMDYINRTDAENTPVSKLLRKITA